MLLRGKLPGCCPERSGQAANLNGIFSSPRNGRLPALPTQGTDRFPFNRLLQGEFSSLCQLPRTLRQLSDGSRSLLLLFTVFLLFLNVAHLPRPVKTLDGMPGGSWQLHSSPGPCCQDCSGQKQQASRKKASGQSLSGTDAHNRSQDYACSRYNHIVG